MGLNVKRVHDIEIENINMEDYPEFCDAYMSYAVYEEDDGSLRELTDDELDMFVEEHPDVFYKAILDNMS